VHLEDVGLLVGDDGARGLIENGLGEGGGEAEVAAGEIGGFFGDEVEFELLGLTGGVEELDKDVAAGLDGKLGRRGGILLHGSIVAKNGGKIASYIRNSSQPMISSHLLFELFNIKIFN